ncbi:Calmodulin-lysine N-methyltransferase [Gigaspora margarita]|uniref:Calmodulin-lysine N-methyltransferase n=1 Tax=Gigaspora margarita TaxID=4874 RepID=A0A8H4AAT0_GIGMA|nr:Calmodulin-lysine N-methyltransferase [Gigaspora margarita]
MQLNTTDNDNSITPAKARWKLLSSIISSSDTNSLVIPTKFSKRNHQGFNLFSKIKLDHSLLDKVNNDNKVENVTLEKKTLTNSEIRLDNPTSKECHEWYSYYLDDNDCINIRIKIPNYYDMKNNLYSKYSGFLSTGNICVWPAEEVLAYYSLNNSHIFKNKNVCEIGGGMCALAGLFIAARCQPLSVTLTDGNPDCIQNIQYILNANPKLSSTDLCGKQMIWDCDTHYDITYDVVICADCTFDKQMHSHLLHVIRSILKKPSKNNPEECLFLLCAPQRGDSLQEFISLLKSQGDFNVKLLERYDDFVWKAHQQNIAENSEHYVPDTHYPLIMQAYWRV